MSSIAGADTTAVSLTFCLYHIISIPRVWDRVCQEIRSKFETSEEITGQSTATLRYLDAVIHECTTSSFLINAALRILPVLSTNPPRITPPEGMTIGGRFIQGNVLGSYYSSNYAIDCSKLFNLGNVT